MCDVWVCRGQRQSACACSCCWKLHILLSDNLWRRQFIAKVISTRQLDFVFSGAGWNVGSGRAADISTWQCDLPVAAAAKVSRRETLKNRQCEFQSLWQFRRRAKLKPAGSCPHTVAPPRAGAERVQILTPVTVNLHFGPFFSPAVVNRF